MRQFYEKNAELNACATQNRVTRAREVKSYLRIEKKY